MPTNSDNITPQHFRQATPRELHNALSRGEELQLQQLRQLEFWQKHKAEFDSDPQQLKFGDDDTAVLPARWELTRGVGLHAWQKQCIDAWFAANERGVIKVVTGAGKTILALAIAERLQRTRQPDLRIAIVVPTLVLLDQWREELLSRSNLPPTAIGLVGGGNDGTFDDHTRILVCVLNSASKKRTRWLAKRIMRPGLLEEVAKQTLSYPITHGARVMIPVDEEIDLFEFPYRRT